MRLLIFLSACLLFACKGAKKPDNVDVWNMVEKRSFSYALNEVGMPDTIFVKTEKYTDEFVSDSSKAFYTFQYTKSRPTAENYYQVGKDGKPVIVWSKALTYNPKGGLATSVITQNGRLLKKEVYSFNDSAKMEGYMLVADLNANGATPNLDTVRSEYVYNEQGNMIAARNVNRRGEFMSRDTFTYYANAPLFQYRIGAKGDTMERKSFKQDGKTLITEVENDSMIFKNHTLYTFNLGQVALNKKNNQKYRMVVKYDPNNRKTEELVYETDVEEKKN